MEHCIQCEPHYIRNYFQIQTNIFIYQTDVLFFFNWAFMLGYDRSTFDQDVFYLGTVDTETILEYFLKKICIYDCACIGYT